MRKIKRKWVVLLILGITAVGVALDPVQYNVWGYVFTPAGTPVSVGNPTRELTSEEIAANNNWVAQVYPSAVYLAAPTSTYNCHDYAWDKVFSDVPHWMEYGDMSYYIWDGSYSYDGTVGSTWLGPGDFIKTSWSPGERIIPGSQDHSEVSTGTEGIVISKWGQCGLYQHTLSDCPYEDLYGEGYNFYKSNYTVPQVTLPSTTTFPSGQTLLNYQGAVVFSNPIIVPANATVVVNARYSAILKSIQVDRGGGLHIMVTP